MASDPNSPGSTSWRLTIDPEIIRWCKARKIAYRKALVRYPKARRPAKGSDVVLFFTDIKKSRYFAATWGTRAVLPSELLSPSNAGSTKTREWRG